MINHAKKPTPCTCRGQVECKKEIETHIIKIPCEKCGEMIRLELTPGSHKCEHCGAEFNLDIEEIEVKPDQKGDLNGII